MSKKPPSRTTPDAPLKIKRRFHRNKALTILIAVLVTAPWVFIGHTAIVRYNAPQNQDQKTVNLRWSLLPLLSLADRPQPAFDSPMMGISQQTSLLFHRKRQSQRINPSVIR